VIVSAVLDANIPYYLGTGLSGLSPPLWSNRIRGGSACLNSSGASIGRLWGSKPVHGVFRFDLLLPIDCCKFVGTVILSAWILVLVPSACMGVFFRFPCSNGRCIVFNAPAHRKLTLDPFESTPGALRVFRAI